MKNNRKYLNFPAQAVTILPSAVLTIGLAVPISSAYATILAPDEVIVTARRTEEVIQNVPISMTIFNQDMLSERNVTSGADLGNFTPSLSVNTRFGPDQPTFAIRGFTQEFRTTASVAVYFADVVAPRAGGSLVTAGDGGGPGAFFDLQNVQVLKGPQGTLFGRNTTGGAIQLVPQEPKNTFGGYVELSDGNYDMHREQGVINIPISDNLRARFGIDAQQREGYLRNVSGIGPDRFADVNYIAGRGSVIWDISDSLSNYTIYSYSNSHNHGSLQSLYACNPNAGFSALIGASCNQGLQQLKNGFYNTLNDMREPINKLKQTQLINTTTWEISSDLTFKNIVSYAELFQKASNPVDGVNFSVGTEHMFLFNSNAYPGLPSNHERTITEELQLQGSGWDDRLTWQGGLYFERSTPMDQSGTLSPTFANCGDLGADPSTWVCDAVPGIGGVVASVGETSFVNKAVYTQGTYDISDEFRMTLGARYTVDKADGYSEQTIYSFPALAAFGGAPGPIVGSSCAVQGADPANNCHLEQSKKSEAPTWLIDVDYLPNPDVMIYAKYARGYRQGSINVFAPSGLQVYDPEKVDAYEIGSKTSFSGPIPGTFNAALFYNKLKDQQIQAGYIGAGGGASTTAVINAGASTIQGLELETTLKLLANLTYQLSYTYLDTHLDKLAPQQDVAGFISQPSAVEGGHLTLSPRHSLSTSLNYRLPISADMGQASIGADYTFVSDQMVSTASTGTLSSRRLVGANMGWKSIAGSGFDASLFVTNALNEKYISYSPGFYEVLGFEARVVGEPRMVGARIKYNFGK